MSKRIKVLQLQPDYNVKAYAFADLAEQIVMSLPRQRYEVVAAFLKGEPAAGQPVSRAERSVYFGFGDGQLKGLRLRALWRLYRFCQQEQFDVVICNRFKPVNMLLQLNRWLRIPVCIGIAHNLGDYDRRYRQRQIRRLANRAWRFVGVSPAVRDELLSLRSGFTPDNTVAITNAIDIEEAESLLLSREEARREFGLACDVRVVGSIGRQVRVKDYPRLIRAFAQVAQSYPGARLLLIGEGRETPALKAEVARLGLEGKVLLPGALPNALRYVRAFDLWVMPSLAEGFPLAMMEAMCGRLPVIASDIPSMHELVAGAGGCLVPPADEAQLAQALANHLALPAVELRARGLRAYDYLCTHHAIDDYRQAYRELIERTLSANQGDCV